MSFDERSDLLEGICNFFVDELELYFLRFFTNNFRQPKFNFHWLRELSSFEVVGDLTLDLRKV